MPKIPVTKPKEAIKALQKAGFIINHISGSHYVLYHNPKKLRAVIPFHNKPLKRKTLMSILKNAELSIDEFKKLL